MNKTINTVQDTTESTLETWSRSLDFHKLADTFGTPTYVFFEPRMRQHVNAYTQLVGEASRILYPVKTNPSMAVLRRLAQWGCGLDCASRDEVELALLAGVPADRISYNTPAPDFGLIRNLLRMGATVVVDSEDLLRRMDAKIPASHVTGAIFIRCNLDAGGQYLQHFQWEDMVHHGASTSKFGIPAESVSALLTKIKLPVTGLHVHVGTMMDNLQTFENSLAILHKLVDTILATSAHVISKLNLGGGLGIGFLPGQSFPSIASLAEHLEPLKRPNITYFAEPGQSLVGDAMGLLTKVVALKHMRGRRWAIIDVGSDQLMKITTVSWHHQILNQRGKALAVEGPDAVGGPLCFAGDTILPATDLSEVVEGEVLFIQHAGAYLEAIANRFNGRRSVGMVVISDEGEQQITRAEDPFFSPPIQTYDWSETSPKYTVPKALAATELVALRSNYFLEHALNDDYDILEMNQISDSVFSFHVNLRASVDFVSVPYAMRIAADAAIIAVLKYVGKEIKDVSVWSSKGTYQYREPIKPANHIAGTIHFSPKASAIAGSKLISAINLDGNRFSMVSEIII